MSQLTYQFWGPTKVLFGAGQLNHLHEQQLPGTKALVVISSGTSARANGYLDRTLAELAQTGVKTVVFDKVQANPTKEQVEEGAFVIREQGCDLVVGLGGGSVLDSAKVMAMFAPQPSDDLWDYAGGFTGRRLPLANPGLPWVAITTTAGTGSEVDSSGVITKLDTREKIDVGSPNGFAAIAVVDPELMLSVPPAFTAYQGFDALFHSLEGHISRLSNPFSDMVQLAAITNVGTYLARAVTDGSDLEARTFLAFANTMSGYSMCTSDCTSEHAMEHAMSAHHPALPHGAGLIMLSRAYFQFWIDRHVCDARFVTMARALGKADASEPQDFIEALVSLQEACGVADLRMSDYGIRREDALTLAQNARATMGGSFPCDPAETTDEEIAGIYEAAWR
ncbi:iron-containing alcohol dehydrogenase [Olsenella sp. HMSC062G07]|uniref:iron-containing alcohol dehydrogenase n=1 Tax=Olsenella sp. HMSC062G07 TaxID=1739330 RepID=UPI0008A537C9|nr:iron-containing alcohol dehydrogenase [Olsenella sp. HMSC062G07]OFK22395.1 alcohol dehydrogenase [Olsenella sp. HMSC062G07]